MDREFLKKLLREQVEPLDIAVQNKLQALKNGNDLDTETPDNFAGNLSDSDIETLFKNTFEGSTQAPVASPAPDAAPNFAESSTPPAPRHKIIADKIAALRGINVDADWYKSNKSGKRF